MDPRFDGLAEILVNYSTRVAPGEHVLIQMVEPEAMPLVVATYRAAVKAGAHPEVYFQSTDLDYELIQHGSNEQIDWIPDVERFSIDRADVWIGIRAVRNPYSLSSLPPAKQAARRAVIGKLSSVRVDNTRWVISRVPTPAFAQQARMPYPEFEGFFFNSTVRDWEAEAAAWERVCQVFQNHNTVRIVGRDTDLTFSTKGRQYVLSKGLRNIPDGEFFTAPVETSTEGHITFDFPGLYLGTPIEGIRLTFKQGKVVEATSSTHEDLLDRALSVDPGARYLGEFGIGYNYGIDRFVYETLFDEKMGGTVHFALGQAYKANRGVNESSLHWDIVKDLRTEGIIYLDGEKVLENGKFLI